MKNQQPAEPLPDPSLPAIRRWFWRTTTGLAASFAAFLVAGWAAGRFIFAGAAPFRFLLGVLTVVVALVLIHLAGRTVNAWTRRIARQPFAPIAGQIVGTFLLAVVGAAFGGALHALGPGFLVASRCALALSAMFVLWLGVLLVCGRRPRRQYPKGASFRDVFGPGPFGDRRKARVAIYAASSSGVRPRDIDPTLLADSLLVVDGMPPEIEDQLYAFYAALDRDDVEGAAALLREMNARSDGSRRMRAALAAETAFFLARYRNEPEAARQTLRDFAGAAHDPDAFVRAAAAIFLAKGRRAAARAVLERLREPLSRRRAKSGVDAFFYDMWAMMLAESAMPPSHIPRPT